VNVPRNVALGLFAILCVAQLAVPANMLWVRERTLTGGESFRFRCIPVDPADALRGRYVQLRFEESTAPAPDAALHPGERIAVPVVAGPDGFARLGTPSLEPPAGGAWIRVEFGGSHEPGRSDVVAIDLPFDRFYMDEARAPEAEAALRRRGDEPAVDAWLTVRVLDGQAVPEELFLDGVPAREYVDRAR